jgi:hypothetical protein
MRPQFAHQKASVIRRGPSFPLHSGIATVFIPPRLVSRTAVSLRAALALVEMPTAIDWDQLNIILFGFPA